MEQVENHHTIAASKPGGMSQERRIALGLVVALLVVAVGMYGWKLATVDEVEKELAEVKAQQTEIHGQLINQAKQLDDRRVKESLRLFSIPFAWAIRRELMVGNLDQVDQYMGELVQISGFKSAVLAKPDGKVIVASDRKKLIANFSGLYPEADLDSNEIRLEETSNGSLRAFIPILGLNRHLGMVVLEYMRSAYRL
jgi:hypothetical protein